MIKEIQYAGYTTEPSDYECPDGQLATSLNLVSEDNQLKTVFPPAEIFALPQGCTIACIHQRTGYKHYIILDTSTQDHNKIWYLDQEDIDALGTANGYPVSATDISTAYTNHTVRNGKHGAIHDFGTLEIYKITTIGNTLLCLTADGMYYFLWKGDTEAYRNLGNHMPEIYVQFSLDGQLHVRWLRNTESEDVQGHTDDRDWGKIYFDETVELEDLTNLSEKNQKRVTEQVLGAINKFIADEATNKGRFIHPFLVRCAYRLYDGSYAMHSVPVLMVTNSGNTPWVSYSKYLHDGRKIKELRHTYVAAMFHQLYYNIDNWDNNLRDTLRDWEDIIISLDIFISQPFPIYDQNGTIKDVSLHEVNLSDTNHYDDSRCFCRMLNKRADTEIYTTYDGSQWVPQYPDTIQDSETDGYDVSLNHCRNAYFLHYLWIGTRHTDFITDIKIDITNIEDDNTRDGQEPTSIEQIAYYMDIPHHDMTSVTEKIRQCGEFYLLKSIRTKNLAAGRTLVDVPKDYLQSLTSRQQMGDDYHTHDTIIAKSIYEYNSRINLTDVTRKVFSGWHTSAMKQLTQKKTQEEADKTIEIYFIIKRQDGGNDIIIKAAPTAVAYNDYISYIFFPDMDAYKALIIKTYDWFEIDLMPHERLNGAVWCDRLDLYLDTAYPMTTYNSPPTPSSGDALLIKEQSKIYTSNVNNPFYFPASGINTVGTGDILALSTAAKALSQGQFGQFPLYAFTTDGVWAMELQSNGAYKARQPITRDVLLSAQSVAQLDNAVLFATDRGIMLLSGSETACITDSIFAEEPFNVLTLPHADTLHTMLGHSTDTCLPVKPFLDFIAGCRMIYDYVHQRVFFFNPATETINGVTKQLYTYAYVYSLKTKLWGMTYSNIQDTINSYPDALAVTHDNMVVSYSTIDKESQKGMYITRPLKIDAPDVHKTISALIQRGHFQRGDVATMLWGSRDLYSWHLVWSSKDHYLRGFRGTPYKYFRIGGVCTLTDGKSIFGASVNYEPRHNNQLR